MQILVGHDSSGAISISVSLLLTGNMLEMEESIRQAVNEVGVAASQEALRRFDTDGRELKFGGVKMYSRGRFRQIYETPYGPAEIERHVYQTSKGGRTFVPLEHDARLVRNATPLYAKQITSKFSYGGAPTVKRDLEANHGRSISLDYIKNLSDLMGAMAQAREADWEYALPSLPEAVKTISIGLDGTCMFLSHEGGWRQAMVGTISLYSANGERLHTIYTGASPEYGKAKFMERLSHELERARASFPDAVVQGLADGAQENWNWLSERTDVQVLDFFHLSEYVGRAAESLYPKDVKSRESWLGSWLHRLKHEDGAYRELLRELRVQGKGLCEGKRKNLDDLQRYMENQKTRLDYAEEVRMNRPIGSGVTEAACKVLIKERMCKSGMRWKSPGASAVIALKALEMTAGRWEQFWKKVMRYGVN